MSMHCNFQINQHVYASDSFFKEFLVKRFKLCYYHCRICLRYLRLVLRRLVRICRRVLAIHIWVWRNHWLLVVRRSHLLVAPSLRWRLYLSWLALKGNRRGLSTNYRNKSTDEHYQTTHLGVPVLHVRYRYLILITYIAKLFHDF